MNTFHKTVKLYKKLKPIGFVKLLKDELYEYRMDASRYYKRYKKKLGRYAKRGVKFKIKQEIENDSLSD